LPPEQLRRQLLLVAAAKAFRTTRLAVPAVPAVAEHTFQKWGVQRRALELVLQVGLVHLEALAAQAAVVVLARLVKRAVLHNLELAAAMAALAYQIALAALLLIMLVAAAAVVKIALTRPELAATAAAATAQTGSVAPAARLQLILAAVAAGAGLMVAVRTILVARAGPALSLSVTPTHMLLQRLQPALPQ
jgi:hypothetical protein